MSRFKDSISQQQLQIKNDVQNRIQNEILIDF